MTIKITFSKDGEAVASLEKVAGIDLVYMGFNFLVDDASVVGQLTEADNLEDFFYMFLFTCLVHLPDFDDGKTAGFQLEGPFRLVFESDGTIIRTYIDSNRDAIRDDRYEMELQAFAREVIETSEEFLEFTLEIRTDKRESWAVEEFEAVLRDAKAWYRETYDEDL